MRPETENKLKSFVPTFKELYEKASNYKTNNPQYSKIKEFAILNNCLEALFQSYATIHLKLTNTQNNKDTDIQQDVTRLKQCLDYLSGAMEDINYNINNYSDKVINAIAPVVQTAVKMEQLTNDSINEFQRAAKEIDLESKLTRPHDKEKLKQLMQDFGKNEADFKALKENYPELLSNPSSNQLVETLSTMYNNFKNVLIAWNNGILTNAKDLNFYWETVNEDMSYDAVGNSILTMYADFLNGKEEFSEAKQELQNFANNSKEFFKDFIERFNEITFQNNKQSSSTNDTMAQ